jgi:hypothetical protein
VAQKPDGKPAGVEKVAFTRPAAERIAKVVRHVEAGKRDAEPFGPGERLQSLPYKLRLGTFTGNWDTGEYKTVTLEGSTNTFSVYNWCNPALGGDTASSTESRYVIFGKVQGTQSAVEIQMRTASETCVMNIGGIDLTSFPGYSDNEIQLLGHNESSCLQWYSITTCSTATAS